MASQERTLRSATRSGKGSVHYSAAPIAFPRAGSRRQKPTLRDSHLKKPQARNFWRQGDDRHCSVCERKWTENTITPPFPGELLVCVGRLGRPVCKVTSTLVTVMASSISQPSQKDGGAASGFRRRHSVSQALSKKITRPQ